MGIAFNASSGHSLGVEVELNLVDATSNQLTNACSTVIESMTTDSGQAPKRIKHELFECTAEVITDVCTTVAQARADLESSIGELRAAASVLGADLISSGTHPFTHWNSLEMTPNERYGHLVDVQGWPARRLAITGIHYHVGVTSAERAIHIVNALAVYLPYFLALSSSSPYWHGADTGLHSARTKIFESLSTAGLPPKLDSWKDFEDFMDTLLRADAISSVREVWWDIRPHPDFGTVELRMCDAMPTITEVVSVAALAQSLVAFFEHLIDRGYSLPNGRQWVTKQNKWAAARYGLDASVIIDDRGNKVALRHGLEELIEELAPVARRLGCLDELGHLSRMLETGTSADRQRKIVADGGSLVDVVYALRKELLTDEVCA